MQNNSLTDTPFAVQGREAELTAVLTENRDTGGHIARVLGTDKSRNGYMEGNGYTVVWTSGNLTAPAPAETCGNSPFTVIPAALRPDMAALKQLKVIRAVFDRCTRIVAATDATSGGEEIFRNTYRLLECNRPFSRLWTSSLADRDIAAGFAGLRPGSDFDGLHFATEARSYADRLAGVNVSRALKQAGFDCYPGRLQMPALATVCARYCENRDFKPEPYRIFKAGVEKNGTPFHLTLDEKVFDKTQAAALFGKLGKCRSVRVTRAEQKETVQEPPLLYGLTALQQDAGRRYGFSPERTLSAARKLYGMKMISHPETDSRHISAGVFAELPVVIAGLQNHPLFGGYASRMDTGNLNRRCVDGGKITGHHALLVTGHLADRPGSDEQTVYGMIAGRMLEAVSPACVIDVLSVQAESAAGMFGAKGATVREAGWRAVLNMPAGEAGDGGMPDFSEIPAGLSFSEGERLPVFCRNMLQKQTVPKPLYTVATLLAAMKHAGTGTPAGRTDIIETLTGCGCMERDGDNTLLPSRKGMQLYRAVKGMRIADVRMAADMERKLSQIEKQPALRDAITEEIREYTRLMTDEILTAATLQSAE